MDKSTCPRIHCALLLLGMYLRLSMGQESPAPHIIVFMVDDLGWNDVGFHGSNQIPTPNIDALAYNGVILNRHYVLPSSTPTRAAFFSGKYPIRLGMQGESLVGGEPRGLPFDTRILPEYLRELGYSPKLIGKWHLGFHTLLHTPLHRGFDSFLGFYNSHINYHNFSYGNGNMSGFDLHRGDAPAYDLQNGRYATNLFTEEALKIIERHNPRHPLYLQINHLGVHHPFPKRLHYYGPRDFSYLNKDPDRQTYAMMVSEIDDSLGQIVTSLGDAGLLKNSIIVFLTDNGAPAVGKDKNSGSNWPLRGSKYSLYEGGVRGVAAIWSPRLREMANVSNNLMHVTDWLPTLYSAAGGDVCDLGEIDGIDHWPHFSKGQDAPRDCLLLNIDQATKNEAAICGQFKLIRSNDQEAYYDYYSGDSGKDSDVPEYNFTLVHRSAVASAISIHLGHPMTQPSFMSILRYEASVMDLRNNYNHFPCRNESECLFNIFNDPCETINIAKQYPKNVLNIASLLKKYGDIVVPQKRRTTEWRADPRYHNSTWVPWLNPTTTQSRYGYNAATALSTLAVSAHIGMVLLIVGLRAYI